MPYVAQWVRGAVAIDIEKRFRVLLQQADKEGIIAPALKKPFTELVEAHSKGLTSTIQGYLTVETEGPGDIVIWSVPNSQSHANVYKVSAVSAGALDHRRSRIEGEIREYLVEEDIFPFYRRLSAEGKVHRRLQQYRERGSKYFCAPLHIIKTTVSDIMDEEADPNM